MILQFFFGFLHLLLVVAIDTVGQEGKQGPLGDSLAVFVAVQAAVVIVQLLIHALAPFLQLCQFLVLLGIGGLDHLHQLHDPVTCRADGGYGTGNSKDHC